MLKWQNYCKTEIHNAKKILFYRRISLEILFRKNCDSEFDRKKILFYKKLQKRLFSIQYFVHHNYFRQFYMDVDFSQKKMNVMMYHFKQITNGYSVRFMIKLIMFLNKKTNDAEFRYWLIELKIIDLMWILKKTRHMIDFAQQPFIIYTDHKTAIKISRQKKFPRHLRINWIFD